MLEHILQTQPEDFATVLPNTAPRMLSVYLRSQNPDVELALRLAHTLKPHPQMHAAALRMIAVKFDSSDAQDAAARVAYEPNNSEIKSQLLQIIGETDGNGNPLDSLARKILKY